MAVQQLWLVQLEQWLRLGDQLRTGVAGVAVLPQPAFLPSTWWQFISSPWVRRTEEDFQRKLLLQEQLEVRYKSVVNCYPDYCEVWPTSNNTRPLLWLGRYGH